MEIKDKIPTKDDLNDTYTKTVRMQATGADGKTVRISIPRAVVQREAKKHKLSLKQFLSQYRAEWRYNSFEGAYMVFTPKTTDKGDGDAGA